MDERQLRERLAKIKALFDGATTEGEREAAKAAMHRVQSRLDQAAPPQLTEYRFSLTNPWSLRLFLALCRSKGLKPYRYPRMRRTSVCVRMQKAEVERGLWPEFQEMNAVLRQYLDEVAEKIIAESIGQGGAEAEVIAGELGPGSGPELGG
jgi:hypothetical protein